MTGDEHVWPALTEPLKRLLPSAQVAYLNPDTDQMPNVGSIDLIVLGMSKAWGGARSWLSSLDIPNMPPIISIDFNAGVHHAVEIIRMGVTDYIDINEADGQLMVDALARISGLSPTQMVSEDTDIAPHLKASMLQESGGVPDHAEVMMTD